MEGWDVRTHLTCSFVACRAPLASRSVLNGTGSDDTGTGSGPWANLQANRASQLNGVEANSATDRREASSSASSLSPAAAPPGAMALLGTGRTIEVAWPGATGTDAGRAYLAAVVVTTVLAPLDGPALSSSSSEETRFTTAMQRQVFLIVDVRIVQVPGGSLHNTKIKPHGLTLHPCRLPNLAADPSIQPAIHRDLYIVIRFSE